MITGIGPLVVYIVCGIVGFLLSILISAWIIKIGVRWGIGESKDFIKKAVHEAILSTGLGKKHIVEKDYNKDVCVYANGKWYCPKCGQLNKKGIMACQRCSFTRTKQEKVK